MEATCPHLGAPLECAPLESMSEDAEDDFEDLVVVCPWHQYDFSLRTGESATGLQTCVYAVHALDDAEGVRSVYIEAPKPQSAAAPDSAWECVEVRAVSERVCLRSHWG